MPPYEFYKIYSAIKLHFNTKYDFFKYSNKSKSINVDAYEKSKDILLFEMAANKIKDRRDAFRYCTFNFINNKNWLYLPLNDATDVFLNKQKYYARFKKNILVDCEFVENVKKEKGTSYDEILRSTKNGNIPPFLQMYVGNYISIEFACIVNITRDYISSWEVEYKEDPLLANEILKIKKYTPFVKLFSKS